MADNKTACRWIRMHTISGLEVRCVHPLLEHLGFGSVELDTDGGCHGCPCHEPQPDPTPNGGKTGHDRP